MPPLIEHGIEPPAVQAEPTRRGFLQLAAGAAALAGLAGCRWPTERILPFSELPEGRTPGVPQRFATCVERGGVALGLLVTRYDGRPVKVEGNPLHPGSLGGTDAAAQAAVLELCDPSRSRLPQRHGEESSWAAFDTWLGERLAGHGVGEGLALLLPPTGSPSALRLLAGIAARFPQARLFAWDALAPDAERLGSQAALGAPARPLLDLSQARVLAALDDDLIGAHPEAVRLARQLADARDPDREAPLRLLCAESALTLTGANADRRWGLRPSALLPGLAALVLALVERHGLPLPPGAEELPALLRAWTAGRDEPAFAAPMAAALAEAGPAGVLAVGPALGAAGQALAWIANAALGSRALRAAPLAQAGPALGTLAELAALLGRNAVRTLLILDSNPLFGAPPELGLGPLLARVEERVHLGLFPDETAAACTWHLPMAHALEAWGDARACDGAVSLAQPLIAPLWGGRSALEILGALAGEAGAGHALVRATFGLGPAPDPAAAELEALWEQALRTGISPVGALPPAEPRPTPADLGALLRAPAPPSEGLELRFSPCAKLGDGRFAGSAWLQELPDPISKLCWGNAALLAPATAAALGVGTGDLLAVERAGVRVQIPACLLPGQPEGVVGLVLGYGRRAAGPLGTGVGVDVGPLRAAEAAWHAAGASARPAGGRVELASTQDHFPIDTRGAAESARRVPLLVREASLEEYRHHPTFAQHAVHAPAPARLWRAHRYEGRAWGMVIDLSRCTGCGACTLACQAENNIPAVGREGVLEGRELHWIRVDRYFTGDEAEPGVAFLPVPCMHCETAPCEQVCPVAATQHSGEGLNTMVYNRCVGTRYCANNCPFKVRRFNFFGYADGADPVERMARNPEVTVRSRGVMEKCSYCVQRIAAARAQERLGLPLADGALLPACAQACPAGAIAFGDLNDPASAVARFAASPRCYGLLPELDLRPRTRYLARVRSGGHSA